MGLLHGAYDNVLKMAGVVGGMFSAYHGNEAGVVLSSFFYIVGSLVSWVDKENRRDDLEKQNKELSDLVKNLQGEE